MWGAVGRVGGSGVLGRTAGLDRFLLGAGPVPSIPEPQLLSLNPAISLCPARLCLGAVPQPRGLWSSSDQCESFLCRFCR